MPEQAPAEAPLWRKAISPERDGLQSRVLVAVMLPLLTALCCLRWQAVWQHAATPQERHTAIASVGVSLTFALVVWLMRSATWLGALSGGVICELLELTWSGRPSLLHSGLTPLIALFLLTFLATRAGRRRKAQLGLAEPRTGRRASQVIANLGGAALAAALLDVFRPGWHDVFTVGMATAMLCEVTADTVSSEIGQAFGGTPVLILGFHQVPAGTDGAISGTGTLAGVSASVLVALAAFWAFPSHVVFVSLAWLMGVAGLLIDSLLGATLERKGLLGNDLVNFTSTLVSGVLFLISMFALVRLVVYLASGVFS